jgi:hypothetical protein
VYAESSLCVVHAWAAAQGALVGRLLFQVYSCRVGTENFTYSLRTKNICGVKMCRCEFARLCIAATSMDGSYWTMTMYKLDFVASPLVWDLQRAVSGGGNVAHFVCHRWFSELPRWGSSDVNPVAVLAQLRRTSNTLRRTTGSYTPAFPATILSSFPTIYTIDTSLLILESFGVCLRICGLATKATFL